jgi:hypothetical protein
MASIVIWAIVASSIRSRPLYGLGNEFVFQSTGDKGLNAQLREAGSEMSRFPGGTPSDYWLWSDGWINASSDRSGCSGLPRRPTTVSQLRTYLATTNQSTVLVVNQLQTNLSYQLQGLYEHAKQGTAIQFVELGNEMYDATRPDVLQAYPEPRDYAVRMATYTKAIKEAFPQSRVALVGLANEWDNRTHVWNKQVLQDPISLGADAATIHLYAGIPDTPATPATLHSLLALVFSNFQGYKEYTTTTIPEHFRLWVTEWGIFSNNKMLQNTWFQGLWHVALTAQLPLINRIDIILPYCAVCGDPFMPSFTSPGGSVVPPNATHTPWSRTPSGHAYALLFNASTAAANFASVSFSPNPVLDPAVSSSRTLIGAAAQDADKRVMALFVVNLGAADVDIDVMKMRVSSPDSEAGQQNGFEGLPSKSQKASTQSHESQSFSIDLTLDMYWPASAADVLRQNLAVSDLKHTAGPITTPTLRLPAYGIAVLRPAP